MDTPVVIAIVIAVALLVLIVPLPGAKDRRSSVAIILAGADPRFIVTAADRARIVSMGTIVALTAIIGGASATVATQQALGGPLLTYVPIGVLWAAVVVSLDRWIVSTVDHRDLSRPTSTTRSRTDRAWSALPTAGARVLQLAVRLAMALVIGQLIATFASLAVYEPEITVQLGRDQRTDYATERDRIQAEYLEMRPTAEDTALDDARTDLATAEQKEQNARDIWICEGPGDPSATCDALLAAGDITGDRRNGPVTEDAREDLADAEGATGRAEEAVETARDAAEGEDTRLDRLEEDELEEAERNAESDDGLAARQDALQQVVDGSPAVAYQKLLLTALFMLIELAPLLLKLAGGRSVYGRRERAAAIVLARDVESEAHADADLHAEVTKARRGHELVESRRRFTAQDQAWPDDRGPDDDELDGDDPDGGVPNRDDRGPDDPDHGASGVDHPQYDGAGDLGDDGADAAHRVLDTPVEPSPPSAQVVGGRWQLLGPLPGQRHSAANQLFCAYDLHGQHPGRVVVKKLAPPEGGPRERRHAMREMTFPVGFQHENLAENLDSHMDPDFGYYIVTRLYPGTLATAQQDAGDIALPLGWALQILEETLAGLSFAWAEGYIHRDIKPANIALDENGTVKIIDFGISDLYLHPAGHRDPATSRAFTYFYAPLEQLTGDTSASRPADLWSLAATFYSVVSGRPPMFREAFAAGLIDPLSGQLGLDHPLDFKQLMARHRPLPLTAFFPDLPPRVGEVVDRWLSITPRKRNPGVDLLTKDGHPDPSMLSRFAERLQHEVRQMTQEVAAAGSMDMPIGFNAAANVVPDIGRDWRSAPRRGPTGRRRPPGRLGVTEQVPRDPEDGEDRAAPDGHQRSAATIDPEMDGGR